MEHYKSRNNDFYHFTNPHDDRSELDDDDDDDDDYEHNYDYDNFDDDHSFDFNLHPRYINPISSTYGLLNENDVSVEEVGGFDNQEALVFHLDDRMKSLVDKLRHAIDDIGTRVSRLDDETSKIDKCVEDVKNYEEMYHGTTHTKLRRMQSILQEVQDGVLYLRDKHEIAETQLQLAKLQVSKMENNFAARTNLQQQQPLPASQSISHIPLTPFINQLPLNGVTLSQPVSYHPSIPQSPTTNAQQLVIPPNQQFWTPQESKVDNQFPHYIQSYQGVVGRHSHPFVNNPSPKTPNESSYDMASISFPQLMHVESPRNYKSEFHAKYMPEFAKFSDTHTHGGLPSSYETSYVKHVESSFLPHEENHRSNHTHIPVIQALPHALPTAVYLEEGSSSEENGSAIPIDDIVDKVTAMGFRRDLVRACVRKLTVDGSAVDLNAVLDGMMKNKMI